MSVHRLPVLEIRSNPGWQTVRKSSNQIIAKVDLNLMQTGNDFSSNISIDKGLRELKTLSEDIQLSITSDKTNKRDGSLWDVGNLWQSELWRWESREITLLLDELERGFPFEEAVTMIPVVEELKVLGLRSEMSVTPKPLGPKESSIIGIIKAFHNSITPRFSYRDEDNFDPHQQTEPEDEAKGPGITIASPKAESVVDLEKVWDPHGLPAADQAQSHGLVVFLSLWMEKDPVAVEIDNVERVETAIVFDVSWAHEICLMDIVDFQRLCEIRILDPFGKIRSFF